MTSGSVAPSLVSSFGSGTYFNTALGKQATFAAYKLRTDVFWSDGRPLTGQDVKFSIEYMLKNSSPGNDILFDVSDTQVISNVDGSQTVVVYFDNTNVFFPTLLGFVSVIPEHIWCPGYNPPAVDVGPSLDSPSCPYADMSTFPDFQGLNTIDGSCTDCTVGPNQHVGTGPYVISGCTGVSCSSTILLTPNPYYNDGIRYWSRAAGISLQPDLNRDGRVNQADLDLLNSVDPNNIVYDVDYRIASKGTQTLNVPSSVGSGTLTVNLNGPVHDSIDAYIIQRLILEGQRKGLCGNPCTSGGITWPPPTGSISAGIGSLTYTWPDVNSDNKVDVSDIIAVFTHEFVPVKDGSGNLIPASPYVADVTYSGSIDIDSLVATFVKQFTTPAGVTP